MSIGLSRAASPPAGSIPLLLPLFFVSGFPALIYQLVWQRALFAVYGVNIEAVTVIVSGFLLGLGLGSLAGGRLSSIRGVSLLGAFSAIELCLAAIGFVSLDALDLFSQHAAAWPAWASTVAVLALLLPPTTLMGATLPLLVAYLARRSANVGRSVGLLYFVNTLGSSVACFVAGVWLMRALGMRGSVNAAAMLNLAVGLAALAGALGEARGGGRTGGSDAPIIDRDGARRRDQAPARTARMSAAVLLAALTGYLALSYEMLWFRAFSLAAGTASAFAMVPIITDDNMGEEW